MTTTINASLYAADADEDSDPNAITLTATAADADAAWAEVRARIASVLGVDTLGDIEELDDDPSDPTAPADMKRGTLDGHYIEWTVGVTAPAKKATPKAKKAPGATTALTTKDVAAKLDTDPRTLRIFLRANGTYTPSTAGGGQGRYAFSNGDVTKIRPLFNRWIKERTP